MGYWLSRFFLWLIGWKPFGDPPASPKCVIVAAPHTSNWDAVIMLAIAKVMGVRVRWMIKDTWFWWPLGVLIRALGGLSIDRNAHHGVVDQVIDAFRENEKLLLLITPEGTRRRVEYWKSGFYHIAVGAGVPLALGVVDFAKKRGGFGPLYMPTGDVKRDMDVLREHFSTQQGKYPECTGPIRLREEEGAPEHELATGESSGAAS